MHIKSTETPANYIRFAAKNTAHITPLKYFEELKTLLDNPADDAGEALREFKRVADESAENNPHKRAQDPDTPIAKFYAAVQSAFNDLRHGAGDHPHRWHYLMPALADISQTDPVIEKSIRDNLLAKAIPVLVGPQSTAGDIQAASDILTVAGAYENLEDAVKHEHVHAVVKRNMESFKHKFAWAATFLTDLRASPPFVPVIADIENKHGVHVVGEPLAEDPSQILVVEFDKARHDVSVSVMDQPKHGHYHEPRFVDIDADTPDHHDQIAKILSHSTDLPKQEWVEPIATNATYRLG